VTTTILKVTNEKIAQSAPILTHMIFPLILIFKKIAQSSPQLIHGGAVNGF